MQGRPVRPKQSEGGIEERQEAGTQMRKLGKTQKELWPSLGVRWNVGITGGGVTSDSCFHRISLAAVLRVDCRGSGERGLGRARAAAVIQAVGW